MNNNEKHIIDACYWNDYKPYLIILSKTGIFYSDQVGGMACLHPTLEGFYYPLWFDIDDEIACKKGCMGMQENCNKLNRDLISNEINKQLVKETNNTIINLKFDYERINEMEESLYPVVIDFKYKKDFYNSDNNYTYKGFLITGNCD